ncbi:hypothetical protein M9458_030025, partial [Cirrhinus mrigala]
RITPAPLPIQSPASNRHNSPEPTEIKQPALEKASEQNIAPEPELNDATDQVCEPATLCNAVGVLVEIGEMDYNPTHAPTTQSELPL